MTTTHRKVERGLLAAAVLVLIVLNAPNSRSDDTKPIEKPSPLDGAWKMVSQKNGEAQEYQKLPEGTQMIDHVTGGRFVWTGPARTLFGLQENNALGSGSSEAWNSARSNF